MERIAGHYDKIILTLIMCLAILFLATFSPLAESTNAIAVVDDAIIAIVIAALAAIGITFVTTGSFNNLSDYVDSLMRDYAGYNNTTPEVQLSGIQTGTNKLGQLLVNNRFIVYIQGFASWIIATLHLNDNSNVIIQEAGTTLNGYVSYSLPISFPAIGNNDWDEYTIAIGNAYAIVGYPANNNARWSVLFWDTAPFSVNSIVHYRNNGGTNTSQLNARASNSGIYYILMTSTQGGNARQSWAGSYVTSAELTALYNSLNSGNPDIESNDVGISVTTTTIVLPENDSDYQEGDGAIIDVGATWGMTYPDVTEDVIPNDYSDSKEGEATIEYVTEDEVAEAVESTSEITNLPSGTIPFTPLQLPHLNLSSIWHYVAQWIADTAIAAGSLMAIVVQEPSPMVNLFYATVCLAIIFGVIKGIAK